MKKGKQKLRLSVIPIYNVHLLLDGREEDRFFPTQLGGAVLASALSPDEGLVVFAELQKARKCFVLENELHIVYLVRKLLQSLRCS